MDTSDEYQVLWALLIFIGMFALFSCMYVCYRNRRGDYIVLHETRTADQPETRVTVEPQIPRRTQTLTDMIANGYRS